MRTKKTFGILLLLLCIINFVSCSDDDQENIPDLSGDLFAVEVIHGIDAEQKELITTDLQNNLPVPTGGGYFIDFKSEMIAKSSSGVCTIVDSNSNPITTGSIFVEEDASSQLPSKLPDSYKLALPKNQITSFTKWSFEFKGIKHTYDIILEKYGMQRYSDVRPWLYEDLTEHYKKKFPNAGVKGVVRVQVLTYQPKVQVK
ncbi:hypothetical protein [Bacteroides sp. 51]|uniref:hypothetical protein n=1 Tax=Bacteroides sp. 51 TaxID=2302938 RepID=UPI0013D66A5A|nr:hypothetical protein [Bacteroides sp. 51]NDV82522.1 hypothetical protein [Bacteroides sp. 51]